MLQVFFT